MSEEIIVHPIFESVYIICPKCGVLNWFVYPDELEKPYTCKCGVVLTIRDREKRYIGCHDVEGFYPKEEEGQE